MAPTTRTQPAMARPRTRSSSSEGATVVVVPIVVVVVSGGITVVVHQGTVMVTVGGGGIVGGTVVDGIGRGVGHAVVQGGIVHGDGGVVHPLHGMVGKRVILEERKRKHSFYLTEK